MTNSWSGNLTFKPLKHRQLLRAFSLCGSKVQIKSPNQTNLIQNYNQTSGTYTNLGARQTIKRPPNLSKMD